MPGIEGYFRPSTRVLNDIQGKYATGVITEVHDRKIYCFLHPIIYFYRRVLEEMY